MLNIGGCPPRTRALKVESVYQDAAVTPLIPGVLSPALSQYSCRPAPTCTSVQLNDSSKSSSSNRCNVAAATGISNRDVNSNRSGLARIPPLRAGHSRDSIFGGLPNECLQIAFRRGGSAWRGASGSACAFPSSSNKLHCKPAGRRRVFCCQRGGYESDQTSLRNDSRGNSNPTASPFHRYCKLNAPTSCWSAFPAPSQTPCRRPMPTALPIRPRKTTQSRRQSSPPIKTVSHLRPAGTSLLDLEHFSMDVAAAMNNNNGALELLTPGISLRIIDSYIITATTNGQVNWTRWTPAFPPPLPNTSTPVMVKFRPACSLTGVTSFANSLAQVIQTYKVCDPSQSLSAN